MTDKLTERSSAEECTENVKEVKIAGENECVYSYTVCVILAVIALAISTGAYFAYKYMNHWYLKKLLLVLSLTPVLKQQFNKFINGRSQTDRDQKSDLLFLQRHN